MAVHHRIILLSVLLLCLRGAAQEAASPPGDAAEVVELHDAKTSPASPAPAEHAVAAPDPTVPTGKLKALMTKSTTMTSSPKLPDLVLRGFIKAADRPATAILEADGKRLYTVREGTQFTLHAADGRNLAATALQVSADAIEIEVPDLKERISVR